MLDLKKKYQDREWLIGGGFNAARKRSKKVGYSAGSKSLEMRDFADFIEGRGLVDVPCKGKKFTWYSSDGSAKSRTDRLLVSNKIISS